MRIGRFKKGRLTAYGVVEGDELLEIRGSIYTKVPHHRQPLQIWLT